VLEERLICWGFGVEWIDVAADMVRNVLNAPLPGGDAPFTLSSLEQKDRLHELGSTCPWSS
jgi:hypothetical protein